MTKLVDLARFVEATIGSYWSTRAVRSLLLPFIVAVSGLCAAFSAHAANWTGTYISSNGIQWNFKVQSDGSQVNIGIVVQSREINDVSCAATSLDDSKSFFTTCKLAQGTRFFRLQGRLASEVTCIAQVWDALDRVSIKLVQDGLPTSSDLPAPPRDQQQKFLALVEQCQAKVAATQLDLVRNKLQRDCEIQMHELVQPRIVNWVGYVLNAAATDAHANIEVWLRPVGTKQANAILHANLAGRITPRGLAPVDGHAEFVKQLVDLNLKNGDRVAISAIPSPPPFPDYRGSWIVVTRPTLRRP